MSEKRTYECWAVVDGKGILLSVGEDKYKAVENYRPGCSPNNEVWKWYVNSYGVRLVKLECKEVSE